VITFSQSNYCGSLEGIETVICVETKSLAFDFET